MMLRPSTQSLNLYVSMSNTHHGYQADLILDRALHHCHTAAIVRIAITGQQVSENTWSNIQNAQVEDNWRLCTYETSQVIRIWKVDLNIRKEDT